MSKIVHLEVVNYLANLPSNMSPAEEKIRFVLEIACVVTRITILSYCLTH